MENFKNIGLIECSEQGKVFEILPVSRLNGEKVKKIYVTNKIAGSSAHALYPHAELVNDRKSILDDSFIDLVIVSSPSEHDMEIVGEVLEAGKAVRVLD